jgi:hypothetical protein
MKRKTEYHAPHIFANGAIGWRADGPLATAGVFARVENCPVEGLPRRYTCHATGGGCRASVAAKTRTNGQTIYGFFIVEDGGCRFIPAELAG